MMSNCNISAFVLVSFSGQIYRLILGASVQATSLFISRLDAQHGANYSGRYIVFFYRLMCVFIYCLFLTALIILEYITMFL